MPKTTDKEIRENCKMCKLVDDLAPSMSYCAKHKYFNPMPKNSTAKSIITEEELTDMFGEGGKEEVREYHKDNTDKERDEMLKRFETDPNKWRWFREELRLLGIKEENIVDSIQGYVDLMIRERLKTQKTNDH